MPLANVDNILPLAIPIIIFMIPIVAILTSHQQKMAQILHANRGMLESNRDIEMLRAEVGELKAMMQQQTIAIDNLQLAQRQNAVPLADKLELGNRP